MGGRFCLGLVVRLHRTQEHLFRLHGPRLLALYVTVPYARAQAAMSSLFVLCFLIIVSACMAAAFPPVPAYLADMFGALLRTALSMVYPAHPSTGCCGIAGPVLVNWHPA